MRDRLVEILFFFRANFLALLAVTLPFAVAAALIAYALGEPIALVDEKPVLHTASAVALTLLYPLALGAKVVAVHQLATQGRIALASLVSAILVAWPALLLASIVIGAVVGFGIVFLFVVPGAWFYARLGLAPILVITEKKRPAEALAEAWRRSRARQLDLFLLTLLGGLLLVTGVFMVLHVAAAADASATLGADIVARAVNELCLCLLTVCFYRYWSLDKPVSTND